MYDAWMHDACIHDACIHNVMHVSTMNVSMMHIYMMHACRYDVAGCRYDACIYDAGPPAAAAPPIENMSNFPYGPTNGQGDSRSRICNTCKICRLVKAVNSWVCSAIGNVYL